MIASHPMNADFLALIGASSVVNVPSVVGQTEPRRVEIYLDFMILNLPTVAANTSITFAGAYPGWGWFEVLAYANTSPLRGQETTVKFGISRASGVFYSGDGTINVGQRHVLIGRDLSEIGGGPRAWLDGEALGGDGFTSYIQTAVFDPIDTKAGMDIGYDDFNLEYTKMRVYEMLVKINDAVIMHFRPDARDSDDGSTTLADRSGYGNNGAISGVLNTAYRWDSAWNRVGTLEGALP